MGDTSYLEVMFATMSFQHSGNFPVVGLLHISKSVFKYGAYRPPHACADAKKILKLRASVACIARN